MFDTGRDGSRAPQDEVLVLDSATHLDVGARGRVVVCGSHCGLYPGTLALAAGVRAVVLHAAGVGRDEAGIAALDLLAAHGVPAAAVGSGSARIGSGTSVADHGLLGHLNEPARALGCRPGMAVSEAADLLWSAPEPAAVTVQGQESRTLLRDSTPAVWALDSASLVRGSDAGSIVVTGSHGELLGGRAAAALKADAFAAVFNDAGVRAGPGHRDRLWALGRRAVAAVTVTAASARIGDARSTYADGVISRCNPPAEDAGARAGMPVVTFVDLLLAGRDDAIA